MNKVCIVVPTYPPRYKKEVKDFLDSYYENKLDRSADICFVFSDKSAEDLFIEEIGRYESIILSPNIALANGREIINIKKLYAVQQLQEKYEYMLVMDDDCRFCKDVDLYEICLDFFSRKVLIESQSNGEDIIALEAQKACKRFFTNAQNYAQLNNVGLLWFNQPCIYSSENIRDFFEKTKIDYWWSELTCFDFDYLIYMYYLVLYQGFVVRNCGMRAAISAVEITSDGKVEFLDDSYKDQIYYCASEYMQTILPSDKIFITWHYDREPKTRKRLRKNYKWLFKGGFHRISVIFEKWSAKITLDYRE